jgi:hypothetical protein
MLNLVQHLVPGPHETQKSETLNLIQDMVQGDRKSFLREPRKKLAKIY